MTALSKQDESDLRALDLQPEAERVVREAWEKEKRHPLLTALAYCADIAFSGIFIGSAYVSDLVPVAETLAWILWGMASLSLLAGYLLLEVSTTVPKMSFHRESSVHLSRFLVKNWRGVHDTEYALGVAFLAMLVISMAAGGYLWLSFAYAASYGIFSYGVKSLRNRTATVVRSIAAETAE